ncbi:Pescadillo N-terminus-domain-containing protein [Hysterangium stoloniferum]|nr:Pescadillo N-terminus-domain-containing protein [Hysterangium stoloniferum]
MGRLKQKGKAGAAKAYVTRSAAVKKLQCSLADFRRLCILKGIFPREPRHRKKANKGSSAPTSFYYTKDIAYLAHEPVLNKLREHKAFAKKLSRALGRGEWSSAKSLEEHKPVYTLDHVIKERYPTFIDALRDIDDALCLVTLFANLPSNPRIPPSLIENCTRLSNEWQLYVMRSQSLRKVFLSIKGVYYQAEVMGQAITWLVPYMFTQNIPSDVDVRVMLTFLELYQTLLGFVFFKLYTDIGLVYPPPIDTVKDDGAAGVGAYSLQEVTRDVQANGTSATVVEVAGKKVSGKDVRKTIKSIEASQDQANDVDVSAPLEAPSVEEDEDFVTQPSKNDPTPSSGLPTLKSLTEQSSSMNLQLLAPYTFFLSRETPRPLLEFVIRSFGGKVGWTPSQGGGSPIQEDDESITHVIIDRPVQVPAPESEVATVEVAEETEAARALRLRRKFVQPQWVMDCINKGKILLEAPYARGQTLPPHLSPFGEDSGAYDPEEGMEMEGDEEGENFEEDGSENNDKDVSISDAQDPSALLAAELAAEAAGVDYGTFEKAVKKQQKKAVKATPEAEDVEKDMKKMMLSRKKRKLYEKMKYTEEKRVRERDALLQRRDMLRKERKREKRSG